MHVPALSYLLLDDNSGMSAAGLAAFMGAYAIFIIILIVLGIIIYWRIATKAGYAGALSLLMLVPVVNLVIIILFAFTEWPIERELRAARAGGRTAMPTS